MFSLFVHSLFTAHYPISFPFFWELSFTFTACSSIMGSPRIESGTYCHFILTIHLHTFTFFTRALPRPSRSRSFTQSTATHTFTINNNPNTLPVTHFNPINNNIIITKFPDAAYALYFCLKPEAQQALQKEGAVVFEGEEEVEPPSVSVLQHESVSQKNKKGGQGTPKTKNNSKKTKNDKNKNKKNNKSKTSGRNRR
eukprot:TRINITY_DN1795_c0_g1_i6.p1 TRINITY_DN1795_c0_g1~~TRINITY_DN1795_c0_g1_i6.p1  ORF type:complete len:197 (-),score=26.67 TRINITY_DN1795_c0_g1_i6:111-701(-)